MPWWVWVTIALFVGNVLQGAMLWVLSIKYERAKQVLAMAGLDKVGKEEFVGEHVDSDGQSEFNRRFPTL